LTQDAGAELIQNFGYASGDNVDKFKGLKYKTGVTKAPIVLQDTIAWFECKVMGSYDAGSHIVFFGEVIDSELIDDEKMPMTYEYYRNVKRAFAPKRAPTYIDPQSYGIPTSGSTKGNAEIPEIPNSGEEPGAHGGGITAGNREDVEYLCIICGYSYHPGDGDLNNGINPGTAFEDLPEDWVCPVCRAGTEYFKAM